VLERLRKLPGGAALLDSAREHATRGRGGEVELVGGAVRDLLLGNEPRELDVVVGEDALSFADTLAGRLSTPAADGRGGERPEPTRHERFGTALLRWHGGHIDVATRRAEHYAAPGALPQVRAGSAEEDLLRRDFTVNAIAVALDGDRPGELRHAPRALEDLLAGRLRVLHDASFDDDPTRLLRLARYAARLGFQVEPPTTDLAARAIARGALQTISGARIGAELRLALAEPDAVGALAALDGLGLLAALHPRLRFERPALERALALLPDDGRPDLLSLAELTLPLALRAADDSGAEIGALLDRLEFAAADRDRTVAAAVAAPRLVGELPAVARPSELRAAVAGVPPEGIALAGGIHEPAVEPARRWLVELRGIRPAITGDDLLAAGIPEGAGIGRRLERVLELRLDGELADGREAELRAALEARV
jgi:tRNA nucleotidyltransferase (CCA-adding enzyme)